MWAAVLGSRIERYKEAVQSYDLALRCRPPSEALTRNAQAQATSPDCETARRFDDARYTKDAAVQLLRKSWIVEYATPSVQSGWGG